MCPVYYVNDVTGLHPSLILPFKGRIDVGMGLNNYERNLWIL